MSERPSSEEATDVMSSADSSLHCIVTDCDPIALAFRQPEKGEIRVFESKKDKMYESSVGKTLAKD